MTPERKRKRITINDVVFYLTACVASFAIVFAMGVIILYS
jgi:hypothetical protein